MTTYDVRVSSIWGETVVPGVGGESATWPSDNVSVVMPKDLQVWAGRFGKRKTPEVNIFLTWNPAGPLLSFAANPETGVFNLKDAAKEPGGVLSFVLDNETLKSLHAALGMAIACNEARGT